MDYIIEKAFSFSNNELKSLTSATNNTWYEFIVCDDTPCKVAQKCYHVLSSWIISCMQERLENAPWVYLVDNGLLMTDHLLAVRYRYKYYVAIKRVGVYPWLTNFNLWCAIKSPIQQPPLFSILTQEISEMCDQTDNHTVFENQFLLTLLLLIVNYIKNNEICHKLKFY